MVNPVQFYLILSSKVNFIQGRKILSSFGGCRIEMMRIWDADWAIQSYFGKRGEMTAFRAQQAQSTLVSIAFGSERVKTF
jgi:hypothetical protein